MAANGIRFDRFYAGAPLCSPTRASVLTGRTPDRTAVLSHGYAMRRQEKTIAQALKKAGYKTAHFGKWHLNGLQGPGVPVLKNDERSPGAFGFDEWLSVTNFFDMNPVMSRNGVFEEIQGESSEIIVNEALKFIEKEKDSNEPLFVVIWYGSPHSPWVADDETIKEFAELKSTAQHHYGELVAMDKSIGDLRNGLREMNIADNTLLWFNSDNGGLPPFGPETVGGLRGFKNSMYEGGLRVPAVIEFPAMIETNRISAFPTSTMDIFPTIAEIVGLPKSSMVQPIDGISIKPVLLGAEERREQPIPFRLAGKGALVDNDFKLVVSNVAKDKFELYNLKTDPNETTDIFEQNTEVAQKMKANFKKWNKSVEASIDGKDYLEGLAEPDGGRKLWCTMPEYQLYLDSWKDRPEYKVWLEKNYYSKKQ